MYAAIFDTDAVSYVVKGDSRAAAVLDFMSTCEFPVVSFVTPVELHYGAGVREWGSGRRAVLDALLDGFDVCHTSDALLERMVTLKVANKQEGTTMSDADAWIAATALHLNLPLVTNNTRHFRHVRGLALAFPHGLPN